ncbi:hypothetical protein CRG98_025999 [Punica granatum]|uniref:Uncharacterized protein n=1 Tax=Punica granatum TaxID=22663 RepID=A0A2I0JBJ4_PUNGR|nr:hypothetical protein CRG98_025999 [Punica granatum]
MALRCPDSYGVPLMSHVGSTTYFPARVVRQLGGLQTVLEDTARTRFEHTWQEDQTPADRQSNVEQGPAAHEDLVNSPRVEDGGSPGATPTPNMAIQAELTHLRAERDRLCREVAEKDEQLVDQRQLQRELAQTRAELQRRDQELTRANAALERSRKRARRGPYTP